MPFWLMDIIIFVLRYQITVIYLMLLKQNKTIDKLKPEYSILTKAGSSSNFKHSKETLDKFKYRKLSAEAISNLKKAKIGATLSPLAKANQLLATSHNITVRDIETNITKEYCSIRSIRSVARELQVSHSTLLNYVDKNKLHKHKHRIERNKTGQFNG